MKHLKFILIILSLFFISCSSEEDKTDSSSTSASTVSVSTLFQISDEPIGSNCSAGGKRIDTGLDNGDNGGTANDSILQSGEIDKTEYICNGTDGIDSTTDAEESTIETLIKYPLSDVFVSSYNPNDNYSDNNYNSIKHLYVAYYDPENIFSDRFRTFIYFDTCLIPNNTEIISANLELFTSSYMIGSPKIKIQKLNEFWNSETTTWNSQPQHYQTYVETENLEINRAYTFDVVSLIDGNNECIFNYGLALIGSTLGNLVRFHSSEVENINHRPKLTIEYLDKI